MFVFTISNKSKVGIKKYIDTSINFLPKYINVVTFFCLFYLLSK